MNMQSTGKRGVLCAGSVVFDILVKPFEEPCFGTTTFVDSIDFRVGGNAANTARALAILGTPARLIGTLGADEPSRLIRLELEKAGVDTGAITQVSSPTAATVVLVNPAGDRQFLHRIGASAEAFAEPLEFDARTCAGMAHFHLASVFVMPHLRRTAPRILQAARHRGLTTSVDTNWDPHGEWMEVLEPCLPGLDLLFMNEDESRMVTGSSDPAVAAEKILARGTGTVVVKLSASGCAIYSAGTEVLCPAFEVDAVDSTGAGDCFVAGYLSACLGGAPASACGTFANAVGALTVCEIGAVEGVMPAHKVEEWIGSAPIRPSSRTSRGESARRTIEKNSPR